MRPVLLLPVLALLTCAEEPLNSPSSGGSLSRGIEGTWLWIRTVREATGVVLVEADPKAPVYWYFDDHSYMHQLRIDDLLAKGFYRIETLQDESGVWNPVLFTELRPNDESRFEITIDGPQLDELSLLRFEARPRRYEFVLYRRGPPSDDYR